MIVTSEWFMWISLNTIEHKHMIINERQLKRSAITYIGTYAH